MNTLPEPSYNVLLFGFQARKGLTKTTKSVAVMEQDNLQSL